MEPRLREKEQSRKESTTRKKMPKKPPFASGAKRESPEPRRKETAEEAQHRMEEERRKAAEDEAQKERRRSHNRRNTIQKRRKKARLAAEKVMKKARLASEKREKGFGTVDEDAIAAKEEDLEFSCRPDVERTKERDDLSSENSSGFGDDFVDVDQGTAACAQTEKGAGHSEQLWEKKRVAMDSDSGTASPQGQDCAGNNMLTGSRGKSLGGSGNGVSKSVDASTVPQFNSKCNEVGMATSESGSHFVDYNCSAVRSSACSGLQTCADATDKKQTEDTCFAESENGQAKKKMKKKGKIEEHSTANSGRNSSPFQSSTPLQHQSFTSRPSKQDTSPPTKSSESLGKKEVPLKQTGKDESVRQSKPTKSVESKAAKSSDHFSKVANQSDRDQPQARAPSTSVSQQTKQQSRTDRQSLSKKNPPKEALPQASKTKDSVEIEEEDWDLGSAFAHGRSSALANHRSQKTSTGKKELSQTPSSSSQGESNARQSMMAETIQPAINTAEVIKTHFAQQAMDVASKGDYGLAVVYYTRAIEADSDDFVLYSNRSWCYERAGNYTAALQDAEMCIRLSPDWAKGHARRGQALAGLKNWKQAEEAFEVVLGLDPAFCGIEEEINRMRVQQLVDMGFSLKKSQIAVQCSTQLGDAIEMLLNDDIGTLQEDDLPTTASVHSFERQHFEPQPPPQSMAPSATPGWAEKPNLKSGICTLWVGNVNTAEVSRRDVAMLFARCGDVESVNLLPSKHCAFVNYKTAEAAAHALRILQGHHLAGFDLLLRYPENMARKAMPNELPPTASSSHSQGAHAASGRECQYWRGKGCNLGSKCRNLHIPKHKGIDYQPFW